jgi:hypothetical protein
MDDGGIHLDAGGVGDARQTDRDWHLLGRGRWPRRHHSRVGLRRPARRVLYRYRGTSLKRMFGYDDALDAFGVHAIGGAAGALLTGVLAVEQYGGTAGLLEDFKLPRRGPKGPLFRSSSLRKSVET